MSERHCPECDGLIPEGCKTRLCQFCDEEAGRDSQQIMDYLRKENHLVRGIGRDLLGAMECVTRVADRGCVFDIARAAIAKAKLDMRLRELDKQHATPEVTTDDLLGAVRAIDKDYPATVPVSEFRKGPTELELKVLDRLHATPEAIDATADKVLEVIGPNDKFPSCRHDFGDWAGPHRTWLG